MNQVRSSGSSARRDQVLLHAVEAAAVHLPGLAADARRQAARSAQAGVQMDEVERRADPGDAGDQMIQRTTSPTQSPTIAAQTLASIGVPAYLAIWRMAPQRRLAAALDADDWCSPSPCPNELGLGLRAMARADDV